MCVMGINFVSFYDFSIGCWNCPTSNTNTTQSEQFQHPIQIQHCRNSSNIQYKYNTVGTVPTSNTNTTLSEQFQHPIQIHVFVLDVGTVPTVLYLYVFILLVHVKSWHPGLVPSRPWVICRYKIESPYHHAASCQRQLHFHFWCLIFLIFSRFNSF
jgi:hypothetical protein